MLQTLAANALATQTQNARQAASAKEIDLQPMSTLLKSYAWPVRDALERLVEKLKIYRGEEDNDVRIEGLDQFEATMEDAADVIGAEGDEDEEEGDEKDFAPPDTPLGRLRAKKGMGLRDLARAAGVSPGALSAMEHGTLTPTSQNAQKLASVLGVSVEQILGSTRTYTVTRNG